MYRSNLRQFPAIVAALIAVVIGSSRSATALEPLRLDGRYFRNPSGKRVVLRGCNLGSWLLLEPWMLGLDDPRLRDQYDIVQTLVTRFGRDRAEALLDRFRTNWMTAREFKLAQSFGFNLVRVPFYHGLLADEEHPFELRDDAFEWLDRAIDLAEQHGMYVILDLHGAPGGQSIDMPSGRVGENRLWTDETCQRRIVWLWQRLAERYRDRNAVIAYDLINEPFGDFSTDIRHDLLQLANRMYDAIREVDTNTLIFVPATTRGLGSYAAPKTYGWSRVGYTDHLYPGLFGNGSASLATHARCLSQLIPAKAEFVERLGVPFLLGEFNVVFDTCDQPGLMRRYFDTFAEHGWLATMWSLRLLNRDGGLQPNNWYLATNAQPFTLPNLHTASADEIGAAFDRLGTMPLVVDEELRNALTTAKPSPRFAMPQPASPISAKPPAGALPIGAGWSSVDVAAHPEGGAWRTPGGAVVVVGGGSDLWAQHDEFQFVHRQVAGDFREQAWVSQFDAVHPYAKAGIMIRADVAPDAPHALVHAFPNGLIKMAWRTERGGTTAETTVAVGGWPLGLGLERRGKQLIAHFTDADGKWRTRTFDAPIALGEKPLVGMIVLSHDDTVLASAQFTPAQNNSARPRTAQPLPNLLDNGSFEDASGDGRTDRAEHWRTWGDWLNREASWTPTRTGSCVLGYHHYRIKSTDSSGWYQDIDEITPGTLHTFRVRANRDTPASGKYGPKSIELRLEHVEGDRVWQIASQTYNAGDIATGNEWSLLSVTATIPGERVRALLIVNPSAKTPRDAAIKFDDASLSVVDTMVPLVRR